MSYPPNGPPPPPKYTPHPKYPQWPQGPPVPDHYGPDHHGPPPPGYYGAPGYHWPPPVHHAPPVGYPYYMPTMMVPVPMGLPEPPSQPSQATFITNHIYQSGENQPPPTYQPPALTEQVQAVESSGDFEWVPTTSTLASTLTGRALVGGHEGWDGSPLWIIRAYHNGDLVPGKLSVRHNAASIPYNGKEVPVQNIEVLCSAPEGLRWVPASYGSAPPSAITGGNTSSGEPIYVGRAKYQLSITPGKVQQSESACCISFAGAEVAIGQYDVLCRVS